jgi:hypothetical protein
MTEFEKAVVEEVRRVRSILQVNEDIHRFAFEINATGRVHDGEVKITFKIGEYGAAVTGNTVDAAVLEFQRRNGYDSRHSGLVLTGPGTVQSTDDIPF